MPRRVNEPSFAKSPNREAGEHPAQSRYCNGENFAVSPLSIKCLRRGEKAMNQSQENCLFLTSEQTCDVQVDT